MENQDLRGFETEGADPVFDFLTLEEAAAELRTSTQGVVMLVQEGGLELRRLQRAGRTLTGLSRIELELLRSRVGGDEELAPTEDLRQRLLSAEIALEDARTDQALASGAFEQVARITAEAELREQVIAGLREELVEAKRETSAAHAEAAAAVGALDRVKAEALEAAREAELREAEERARTESARADRRNTEERLAKELRRVAELQRMLVSAEELEASNARYLDQVERKLAAANHTISHLNRKSA